MIMAKKTQKKITINMTTMPIKFCLASDFNDMFKLSDSPSRSLNICYELNYALLLGESTSNLPSVKLKLSLSVT